MPRKAHIVKREIVPDPMYQSTLVSKFVNCMMYGGKRSTAMHILYDAMDVIQKKTNDEPLKLFKKAVENVKPVLEVKSRRVGGSNYQVPVEVNPFRRRSEEHTSELQSRLHLVCRLLLEKKKIKARSGEIGTKNLRTRHTTV